MITVREHLAKTYPLHFQRICECINEQDESDYYLNSLAGELELQSAFLWAKTEEGHEYWYLLERAESEPY